MLKKLRVHIVPYGYEVTRVVDPLVRYSANKVYLIGHTSNDERAKKYHSEIVAKLREHPTIEVVDDSVNLWGFLECMEKFRSIIQAETSNEIFFNVSTGSKITAMAGMLSCMIWRDLVEPYYAHASHLDVHKPVSNIVSLPVCGISKPKAHELAVLRVLDRNNRRLRKWRLISLLGQEGVVSQKEETNEAGEPKEFTMAAKHSQLRAVLRPMEEAQYVKIEGSGKRSEVLITQEGKDALRMFGEPRM